MLASRYKPPSVTTANPSTQTVISAGLPVAVEATAAKPAQSPASRKTGSIGLCQTTGADTTTVAKKTTPTHVGTLSISAPSEAVRMVTLGSVGSGPAGLSRYRPGRPRVVCAHPTDGTLAAWPPPIAPKYSNSHTSGSRHVSVIVRWPFRVVVPAPKVSAAPGGLGLSLAG